MKKIYQAVMAVSLTLFASASHAAIESLLANICKVVETDDISTLRSKMKQAKNNYNMNLTFYYSGITCSDNTLIQWALKNNAAKTGTLLVKKLKKSELRDADYIAWAAANGLDNAEIIAAINKRTN